MKNLKTLLGLIPRDRIAFSLVELMISLITISCIAAAFTPVITKKLKKQDIALSLAQTSEITNNCSDKFGEYCELCTQAYCIKCSLNSCPDGQFVDMQNCSCKPCNETESNKTGLTNCLKCHKKNNEYVCDECTHATDNLKGYFLKGLDNKTYTNCQPCGKTNGKDNLCFDGIIENSPEYCDNPPEGYYCEGIKLKSCKDKHGTSCKTCEANKCKTCENYYRYSNGNCISCGMSYCYSCDENYCTGCQGDSIMDLNHPKHACVGCTTLLENCAYCEGTTSNPKCTGCVSGYFSSNGICKNCSSLPNCTHCNNNGDCTVCKNGFYLNSNKICTSCNVANCASCETNGKCGTCKKGYYLDNNTCQPNDSQFRCSEANFIKIGNLCVTRKNMGDAPILSIPSTVTIAKAGLDSEYCESTNTKCCWKGATSAEEQDTIWCNSRYSGYSGCSRTSCNMAAAEEICAKFNYAGKTWRLPKIEEVTNWGKYSINLGDNGLDFCDYDWLSFAIGSNACGYGSNCRGTDTYTRCYPYNVRAANGYFYISRGIFSRTGSNNATGGYSVRCVTEME